MHHLEADTCPRGKQAAFGDVPDPALRLTAYWADCEAHLAGDLPAARAVWEAALRTAAGRCGRAPPKSLWHSAYVNSMLLPRQGY